MAQNPRTPSASDRRVIGPWRRGLGTGLVVGGLVGIAAGLAIGVLAFPDGSGVWASVLGGAIFGTVLGAFVGGMSKLEDPPPGEEPGVRTEPFDRPGLTHDEQEP